MIAIPELVEGAKSPGRKRLERKRNCGKPDPLGSAQEKEILMTKFLSEWKILFGNMNNVKNNVLAMCAFMFNVLLYTTMSYIRIGEGRDFYNWTYANIWLYGSLIFFMRLLYNRSMPRFVRSLPCSKKLFTRNINILFEAINSFVLIVHLILWCFFYRIKSTGNLFNYSYIFFFSCIMHFIFSVAFPCSAKLVQKESLADLKGFNVNFGLLAFYVLVFVFSPALTLLMKFMLANEIVLFMDGGILFFVICFVIVGISCVLNRMMFNRLYEGI